MGLGRMGETHLRNLGAISGVRVVVVADPQAERAERGRVMSGAESALTEPEKAVEHPSVDAVVIVTPTDTHARLIEAAANAGKAVFSEKPIALDLAQTQRVVRLVQERNVPVQLGFMRRYYPGYAKAKAKIEAGELGKLETFRALSRDTACSWRRSLRHCGRAAPRPPAPKTPWKRSAWPSLPPGAGARTGRSRFQRFKLNNVPAVIDKGEFGTRAGRNNLKRSL